MQVEINDTVIEAMQNSIARMYSYASVIKSTEEFWRTDSVGDAVRHTHSCVLTEIAIIKEFVTRYEKQKK